MRHWLSPSLTAILLCAGCGGSAPPAEAPKPHPTEPDHPSGGNLPDVSAEIGSLDEGAVNRAFDASIPGLQRCLADGARHVELIAGSVGFYVKIDQSGSIAHSHLERSTIGHRETEKCMLGVLAAQTWPKPQGGKAGIAKKGFDFDAPNDGRPPASWDADRARSGVRAAEGKIRECTGGQSGFAATLYIGTDGKVMSVSVTPPDEDGEGKVDCIVAALSGAKFESPGSWPAKVSLDL